MSSLAGVQPEDLSHICEATGVGGEGCVTRSGHGDTDPRHLVPRNVRKTGQGLFAYSRTCCLLKTCILPEYAGVREICVKPFLCSD